ncbi:PD-(D/E)XK motif protein [Mumia sp. DW29H23]|uniref:PD-(D/E)XK motif protein n=1 Tax=Mumia sp. DW29H23 TaxID=3421241 RepID=UPI003D69BEED
MTASPDDARHLTFTTLDQLWSSGAPMMLPIEGDPPCRLRLDPRNGLITLITAYEKPEPEVANLLNVGFDAVSSGEEDLAELTVRIAGNVHGAYGLLATIADQLQVQKLPLAVAVAAGVARHREVLAGRGALTTEKEVGLFGELLFLEFLIPVMGAGPAIAAWQGPLSEEHDFTLGSVDVEVKTTSGDGRRHVIHGMDQLVAVRGVPLSLLSIQLTRSAPDWGRTLPQLIAQIRSLAGGHQVAVDAKLDTFGWRTADADLYPTSWVLRNEPRAYAVRGDFPLMTPDVVGPVIPSFGLISDVSYRLDLTHLEYDSLPYPLADFAEAKEN